METQEFFKKWKSDSPKSFEEFKKYLKKHNLMFAPTNILNLNYNDESIIMDFFIKKSLNESSNWQCIHVKFEMLTGIIHKFFFDNNINSQQIFYNYAISNNYILNQEIEKKAFLKAVEIMEKELG